MECERLQGFPDHWTDIPGASDSARYKALGNERSDTVCGFCSPWYRLFFAQDEGGERTIRLVVLLPFSGNLCWVSS